MIYQKERPRIFDDILGQEYIVENIRNQSVNDSWFNVYILAGQYGSGKTSMGYVIARAANCRHRDDRGNPCLKCEHCLGIQSGNLDFWEIDGADNSSVEDIRKLKEYISFYPTKQKWKVVIIDEVHMLSKSAFNCLLKLLETPPPYVIIILCTTDLFAIPITVRSRAATYCFTRIPHQDIMKGLRRAAPKYEITLDESACSLIAHYSDGSMRNAYMLLEQVSVVTKQIDEAACMAVLGIVDEEGINAIISMMLDRNLTGFLEQLDRMEQTGKSFSLLATDLLKACADLVMAACGCGDSVGGTSYYKSQIIHLAGEYKLHDICQLSSLLRDIRKQTESGSKYDFIIFMISVFEKFNSVYDRLNQLEQVIVEMRQHGLAAPLPEPGPEEDKGTVIAEQPRQLEDTLDIDQDYRVPVGGGPEAAQNHVEQPRQPRIPEILTNNDDDDDFYDGLFGDFNQDLLGQYGTPMAGDFYKVEESVPFEEITKSSIAGVNAAAGPGPAGQPEDAEPARDSSRKVEDTGGVPAAAKAGPGPGASPSQLVRQAFEAAIAKEPILLSKYKMQCTVEDTPEGIAVLVPDQGTLTQLLLFVSNSGIPNIEVRLQMPG